MKYYNRIILIIGLLVMAAGCKIAKDLQAPEAVLPLAFNGKAAEDTAGMGELSWKCFFRDEVLQGLIDSALAKNPDMRIALKNIEAAQLVVRQSRWNNVPVFDFNTAVRTSIPSKYSLNGITASQFLGTSHIEDYTAAANLSWEADVWGRIRNTRKAALAAYLQTEEVRKTLQADLVASVSKGYFNLLMLDEQLRIAERNRALNDSTLQMVQVQFNVGQVTALAVEQAQAQLLAAAAFVPQLKQEIALQENALHILAGELPGTIHRHSILDQVTFPDGLSAGIPSAMVRRRPDVKSRELDLVIANAKVGISKAQMYPALRITASGGINALKASDWFNIPGSLFGIAGASVLQPLLQHKELRTQYKLAGIEREKTVLLFRQTVLKAVGEVSDAMLKIGQLNQQHLIAAERVATLRQATANAGFLFQNGMATYLEVITAQGNVLQSELELASVKRQELAAMADLYRSLGGGIN